MQLVTSMFTVKLYFNVLSATDDSIWMKPTEQVLHVVFMFVWQLHLSVHFDTFFCRQSDLEDWLFSFPVGDLH